MTSSDLDWVIALAAKVPEAPKWPRQEYEGILRSGPEDLVVRFPLVGAIGDEPVGFAVSSLIRGEPVAELESIVVDRAHQRCGLGSQLLRSSMVAAIDAGARAMCLEVRESNIAAICFYRRLGFELDGRRPSYYSDPAEDALVFKAEMTPAI
jgi:[ribosomal protein S18]-alanine N-acetyltransferase